MMKATRRTLIVAILAGLGFAAMAAPAAAEFTAESYPVSVFGEQDPGEPLVWTGAGSIECEEATFAGELSSFSESLGLSPSFGGCTAFGFTGANFETNGCTFLVTHSGEEEGDLELVCPSGKEITIKVLSVCELHIPPQLLLKALKITNVAKLIRFLISASFSVTVTKLNFLCPVAGGEQNMALEGAFDLEGSVGIDVG